MARLYRGFLAIIMGLIIASSASAQTVGETTVGGGVSLFGPTLQGTYQIEPSIRLRGVAIGGLGYSDREEDDDGNVYDVDLSVTAAAMLVDHFPEGPGWRLSGGLLINLSDFEATGTGPETQPFTINGETFTGGSVLAEASTRRSVAPMVTIGYDYDLNDQWILGAEVGAIYVGGFDTSFNANSAPLQDEIDNNDDFEDFSEDARDLLVLPYLSITMSYRF